METEQATANGAARQWKANRKPGPAWRLARLLIASSKQHAFLDRGWLPWMMKCSPRRLRKSLALRLLSLSPHYWMHQWLECYPLELSRRQVLQKEYERNLASRQELCDKLLRRYLQPHLTVLDFGCGPGFLARAVSRHVQQVLAADVSRGVLACARALNGASNIRYLVNGASDLAAVADASVDLVYSFAVIQHLRKQQSAAFFREFARVLRPGGQGVVHFIHGASAVHEHEGWEVGRVEVRMVSFTEDEITSLLRQAGFRTVDIVPVSSLCDIDDNIGTEHLALFGR